MCEFVEEDSSTLYSKTAGLKYKRGNDNIVKSESVIEVSNQFYKYNDYQVILEGTIYIKSGSYSSTDVLLTLPHAANGTVWILCNYSNVGSMLKLQSDGKLMFNSSKSFDNDTYLFVNGTYSNDITIDA